MNRATEIGASAVSGSPRVFEWLQSLGVTMTSSVALLDGMTWRRVGYLFAASAACTLIDVQWCTPHLVSLGAASGGLSAASLLDKLPAQFQQAAADRRFESRVRRS